MSNNTKTAFTSLTLNKWLTAIDIFLVWGHVGDLDYICNEV